MRLTDVERGMVMLECVSVESGDAPDFHFTISTSPLDSQAPSPASFTVQTGWSPDGRFYSQGYISQEYVSREQPGKGKVQLIQASTI